MAGGGDEDFGAGEPRQVDVASELLDERLHGDVVTAPSQHFDKLFGRNFGLAQNAGESADLQLAVKRNDAASLATPHHDMATLLAHLFETESL